MQKTETSASPADFYGALCLDIDPSGPLNDYFVIKNDKYATYMMFNSDEKYDTITDLEVTDLKDSEFKIFSEKIVGNRVKMAGDWDTVKVESLLAWSKRARLYDNEHLIWGVVDFTLSSSKRGE